LSRAGLAAVTGGVEVTLLDLTNGYATLARGGVRVRPRVFEDERIEAVPALGAAACAAVSETLSSRNRTPRGLAGDVPWFMWKTGTSSGRRDAWAVGHDGRFAIGVWVGAKGGAARAELVGAEAAEPLLARLFALPELRLDEDPPRAPEIVLAPDVAREAALEPLAIVEPADGARLVAVDGPVIVALRASRAGGLTWFEDGALVGGEAPRIGLGRGAHEIRCVAMDGAAARARVVVR
jgi:penicillin-binding protein 1C